MTAASARSSKKDGGMYDAVNCGCRRAQAEVLVCLNCDGQSLAGVDGEISLLPATSGIYPAAPYDESCAGKKVSIRNSSPAKI